MVAHGVVVCFWLKFELVVIRIIVIIIIAIITIIVIVIILVIVIVIVLILIIFHQHSCNFFLTWLMPSCTVPGVWEAM